jgi:hypothetical protein
MGNVKKAFHVAAITRNPDYGTATFIVPELQGPLFAGVALRRPCHSAASSRSVGLLFVSGVTLVHGYANPLKMLMLAKLMNRLRY